MERVEPPTRRRVKVYTLTGDDWNDEGACVRVACRATLASTLQVVVVVEHIVDVPFF